MMRMSCAVTVEKWKFSCAWLLPDLSKSPSESQTLSPSRYSIAAGIVDWIERDREDFNLVFHENEGERRGWKQGERHKDTVTFGKVGVVFECRHQEILQALGPSNP